MKGALERCSDTAQAITTAAPIHQGGAAIKEDKRECFDLEKRSCWVVWSATCHYYADMKLCMKHTQGGERGLVMVCTHLSQSLGQEANVLNVLNLCQSMPSANSTLQVSLGGRLSAAVVKPLIFFIASFYHSIPV
jgi:hypothetical protein